MIFFGDLTLKNTLRTRRKLKNQPSFLRKWVWKVSFVTVWEKMAFTVAFDITIVGKWLLHGLHIFENPIRTLTRAEWMNAWAAHYRDRRGRHTQRQNKLGASKKTRPTFKLISSKISTFNYNLQRLVDRDYVIICTIYLSYPYNITCILLGIIIGQ